MGKHEIVHSGEAMARVMAQVDRVAASETRVCILGETGTGKELIARALHERSPRRDGPFVTLNCAAVPAELIETELFGHEKGLHRRGVAHLGKFEQAHHGTLFLDEIGDMPMLMQAKLLRVLEEGQVERVGGDRTIPVDVRVIVATHRNLHELVKKGVFRAGPVSPYLRFPAFAAAAARTRRRDSGAGDALRARRLRGERVEAQDVSPEAIRSCSGTRGPAMCGSCGIWWNACCCWRTVRWTRRWCGLRCRPEMGKCR